MKELLFSDRSFPGLMKWALALLGVAVFGFFIFPLMGEVYKDIVIYSGISIILAVSLNLVNGFTGQFSMGHAGFMAVGAYTTAAIFMAVEAQTGPLDFFSEMLLFAGLLLLGGLVAAALGYIVGLPSLRLKGDYLAIVTLGFGEIIRVIILNMDFLGGPRGLSGIPQKSNFFWVYGTVIVTLFVIWRVIQSNHGRAFLAVREDEIAAESMGIDTTQAKVRAFIIGAFFAGVAGGLYGHYLRYLSPAIFDFNRSFEIIIMVVLGGMGSVTGSVVAAVLLTFLREELRDVQKVLADVDLGSMGFTGPLAEQLQNILRADLRMIIFSLVLIALMLTRPKGLFGRNEIRDLMRRKA
ncbi:MAG: branched-chain amino acid ABC transporter permease [Bdellovibrionales bacterium]|nr:branched-chain amino acid ABC transporter permease [Bdellovibrionales bacterium]